MSGIRTVIFDLGGVYFTDGAKRFIKKMEELYGVEKTKVEEVISGELGKQYRTAEITPEEFWNKAKQFWNLHVSTPELSKIWLEGYQPIEGTGLLIEKLRKHGYEVLFLSDNAPDRVAYLESQYNFLGKFKGGVFSHIEKARKPDEKMYKAALDLTSSLAVECVYIDDKAHLLQPAEKLGMKVIAFESPEQIETALRNLQLHF